MMRLQELLGLSSAPVAISFVDAPPAGVPRVSAREAAGCGYWRRAAQGETFYTVADDHKGCPIGAHTHNVPLSAGEQEELSGLVQLMVGMSYLKPDEVPRIPTRKTPLQVAVYAPLAPNPQPPPGSPLAPGSQPPPDVVLVRGTARQLMLLSEAAQAAGVAGHGPALGRPTCAVLPEAINSARTSASFGCVGNRVYTGAPDDEGYFAIPGASLAAVEEKLALVAQANLALEQFHRARAAAASPLP